MEKINIAIVGYGNIGKYAVQAVQASPDMRLAGIVRRNADSGGETDGIKVADDVKLLGDVDAALLCTPSRLVPETAEKYLAMGINTVDSYDIHTSIFELRQRLDQAAKRAGKAAIISAGWDPGSDSVVRAMLEACAPNGITYTDFGPGMSMGHSVAVKAIDGVRDALSVTIPTGTGIHRRMVYVELEPQAKLEDVEAAVKADAYFVHDETHVTAVDDLSRYIDMGHGVKLTRKGVSGATHNQMFEFGMRINNPALTSQIMVSCARAAVRQAPGAYTMIELPMIDLLPGGREELIRRLV